MQLNIYTLFAHIVHSTWFPCEQERCSFPDVAGFADNRGATQALPRGVWRGHVGLHEKVRALFSWISSKLAPCTLCSGTLWLFSQSNRAYHTRWECSRAPGYSLHIEYQAWWIFEFTRSREECSVDVAADRVFFPIEQGMSYGWDCNMVPIAIVRSLAWTYCPTWESTRTHIFDCLGTRAVQALPCDSPISSYIQRRVISSDFFDWHSLCTMY